MTAARIPAPPGVDRYVIRPAKSRANSNGQARAADPGGFVGECGFSDSDGQELSFIAVSETMRKLRAQAEQIARVDVPVLCLGESGTGKEVVAHWIHQHSPRAGEIFLKVNCAAMPAELLESELFGHEAGAFTGAVAAKRGKFELCQNGTILLDEIAEMPAALQVKLLHVLEGQEFTRLGATSPMRLNVRIIAATNADIDLALATGRLREDIFYRLSAFIVRLPPLRQRPADIPALLRHCLGRAAARYGLLALPLSERLMAAAARYSWPGNIRELENFAERYLVLGEEEQAIQELAGGRGGDGAAQDPAPPPEDLGRMRRELKERVEKEAIRQALAQTSWNRREAARRLQISYKTLLSRIRDYGLERFTA